MSGGGIFNTNGQLIGINSVIIGGPALHNKFKLGVRHVSVMHILEQVRELVGQEESQKIFSCP